MTFALSGPAFFFASMMALLTTNLALAQEVVDLEQLADELNESIITVEPGVTLRFDAPHTDTGGEYSSLMLAAPSGQIPDFAIVARDTDGKVQDIFGPQTPYEINDGEIKIPGYVVPKGGSLELAGAETWVAVMAQADEGALPPMDRMFDPLVGLSDVVQQATAFLAQRLCNSSGRPSEISMYLNAEFKFIIGGETGTEVTWNFDEVCGRLGYDEDAG